MNLLKNRTVLGIICITLSLMICFVITPLFNKEMAQKTEIVRVTQPIFTGQVITQDMVSMVEVGGYNLPETVIKNMETAVGSYALANFAVGDYILTEKVSDTMQAENAYLYNLDGSQQAISLTIPSLAGGLSGKLESGDIISVIAADFRQTGETVIPPELKYVEVISVTTKTGEDANLRANQPDREDESAPLPSTVTLLVNDLQSKLIAELEAESDVHMALVFRGEKEDAKVFLDAQNEYLISLENRDGYYFDDETGEWVQIPTGFYFDEATKTLMKLPEGFQYDKETGTLIPVEKEEEKDTTPSEPTATLPQDVVGEGATEGQTTTEGENKPAEGATGENTDSTNTETPKEEAKEGENVENTTESEVTS
ncbi:MAG: SAF domain-containing protein [Eubacteriales bacterium]